MDKMWEVVGQALVAHARVPGGKPARSIVMLDNHTGIFIHNTFFLKYTGNMAFHYTGNDDHVTNTVCEEIYRKHGIKLLYSYIQEMTANHDQFEQDIP